MAEIWKPAPHQILAAKFLIERDMAALFLRPGMRKTSISLAVIRALRKRGEKPALVIAGPRICYSVWPGEIARWRDFQHLKYTFLHPSWVGCLTYKDYQMGKALWDGADIHAVTHQGLVWLAEQIQDMQEWPYGSLWLDESTEFGNARSTRSELVQAIRPAFKRVYELTGSPANNLEKLFAQIKILDNGFRLGAFITHFRTTFGTVARQVSKTNKKGWHVWTPAPDAERRIAQSISDIALYMGTEGNIEMPERYDPIHLVELPKSIVPIYLKMERDYFAIIKNKKIRAVQAAAAQMKLRQIISGWVYDENRESVPVHMAKLNALKKLLEVECADKPVLIGVAFQHEAAAIQRLILKMFQVDVPYLGKGITPKKSDAALRKWNAGNIPAMPVHPASAAHGLNMQYGGSTVIWFSLTWDAEEYDQLNRRVWRSGQEDDVIIHHLITKGTVDEPMLTSLQSQDATQNEFFKQLEEAQNA